MSDRLIALALLALRPIEIWHERRTVHYITAQRGGTVGRVRRVVRWLRGAAR